MLFIEISKSLLRISTAAAAMIAFSVFAGAPAPADAGSSRSLTVKLRVSASAQRVDLSVRSVPLARCALISGPEPVTLSRTKTDRRGRGRFTVVLPKTAPQSGYEFRAVCRKGRRRGSDRVTIDPATTQDATQQPNPETGSPEAESQTPASGGEGLGEGIAQEQEELEPAEHTASDPPAEVEPADELPVDPSVTEESPVEDAPATDDPSPELEVELPVDPPVTEESPVEDAPATEGPTPEREVGLPDPNGGMLPISQAVEDPTAPFVGPHASPVESARDQLAPTDSLTAGEELVANNGQYQLVMQSDGNLVLYTIPGQRVLWHTHTNGNPGAFAIMQSDGNFVLYDANSRPLSATGTAGRPGAGIVLQTDGNLVMYREGAALWSSGTQNATLAPGETLREGHYLTSADGRYRIVMQGDGNVVLYTPTNRPLWATWTQGNPGARFEMQSDGNLVVYSRDNRALWNSRTNGRPGGHLAVQSDGNVVIYVSGKAAWASGSINNALAENEGLVGGQYLTSSNGAYQLVMQYDGNLVLYGRGRALWNSQTQGHAGARVVMQGDGNLVVYTPTDRSLWASWTNGNRGVSLAVQDDGNLVLYGGGRAIWNTGTMAGGDTSSAAEAAASAAEARLGQVYTSENRNAGHWSGYCQTFVEVAYGHRFRYGSANAHYEDRRAAGQIQTGVPPRGAIVFYGGGGGYGHIAIGVGNGQIVGTMGYSDDRLPISRTSYTYFGEYRGWAMPY